DGVEPERVDLPDRLLQQEMGPWAFAKLVGVMMDEPARVELHRELGFSAKNPLPLENWRRCILARVGAAFDPEDAAADVRLDRRHRAVGGAVIEEIDVDALLDQIADDVPDDVGFVIG